MYLALVPLRVQAGGGRLRDGEGAVAVQGPLLGGV